MLSLSGMIMGMKVVEFRYAGSFYAHVEYMRGDNRNKRYNRKMYEQAQRRQSSSLGYPGSHSSCGTKEKGEPGSPFSLG